MREPKKPNASEIVRQRIYYCACNWRDQDHTPWGACDPEFMWYEPQDIIKGYKIAKTLGYPKGFWVPYKICFACKWRGHKSQYE